MEFLVKNPTDRINDKRAATFTFDWILHGNHNMRIPMAAHFIPEEPDFIFLPCEKDPTTGDNDRPIISYEDYCKYRDYVEKGSNGFSQSEKNVIKLIAAKLDGFLASVGRVGPQYNYITYFVPGFSKAFRKIGEPEIFKAQYAEKFKTDVDTVMNQVDTDRVRHGLPPVYNTQTKK